MVVEKITLIVDENEWLLYARGPIVHKKMKLCMHSCVH